MIQKNFSSEHNVQQKPFLVKLKIMIPENTKWDVLSVGALMLGIVAVPTQLKFIIEATAKKISWSIITPRKHEAAVIQCVRVAYPKAMVRSEKVMPIHSGCRLYKFHLEHPFPFPLSGILDFGSNQFPLASLLHVMAALEDGEQITYQLTTEEPRIELIDAGKKMLTTSNLSVWDFITPKDALSAELTRRSGNDQVPAYEAEYFNAAMTKVNLPLKEVQIACKIKGRRQLVEQVIVAMSACSSSGMNALAPSAKYQTYQPLLTPLELAALWHLPDTELGISTIEWAANKVDIPPTLVDKYQADNREAITLGTGHFRGQAYSIPLTYEDRKNHVYIVGATNMGKSTLMHRMIHQDILNGKGVGVIDPHGDLIRDILRTSISPEREKDVVHFALRDTDFPIGLNLLATPDGVSAYSSINQTLKLMQMIFADIWLSGRMENVLYASLVALQHVEEATLLDVPRLLHNAVFRAEVVSKITDPTARAFWLDEYESAGDSLKHEMARPVTTRLNAFYRDPTIANIICQKSSLDFRDIIDNQKILLIDLGSTEQVDKKVLGALIFAKIQMAAMSRGAIEKEDRVPFYLYVDEVQRFTETSLPEVFNEARKFGLSLTVGNQQLYQLEGKTLKSLMGNVGATLIFRMQHEQDAKPLYPFVKPQFTSQDLTSLSQGHTVARVQHLGAILPSFSMQTWLPPKQPKEALAIEERIKNLSRQKYARHKAEVVDEIYRHFRKEDTSLIDSDNYNE